MTLCAPIVFVKSRYQLRDVFSNPHGGHSHQRTLDVVPQLECLLLGVNTVARDGSQMGFVGRVEDLPRISAEDCREERTAGNRPSEKQVTSRAELLAPICSGVDPTFKFSEVGAESFSGPIDLRLYFVGCFIHLRFSWSDAIVRSGTGLIRANLRSSALIKTAAPA